MTEPIIKFQPRKDEGEYKAVNDPKTAAAPPRKPFKDLMDKGDTAGGGLREDNLLARKGLLDDSDDVSIAEEAKSALTSPVPSLFDLQKNGAATVVKEDPPLPTAPPQQPLKTPGEQVVENPPESPAQLFKRMSSSKDTGKAEGKIKAATEYGEKKSSVAKKEKMAAPFTLEQPADLSYVNPWNTAPKPVEAAAEAKVDHPAASVKSIQAIIDQIVKSVEQHNVDGKTETIISLKNNPLFEGASVVITTYDTARGQFNLTFQNLTAPAKHLLDMQANQDSLKHALEVKGYAVHILITTTQIEKPVALAESRNDQRDQREGESGGGGGRQQERGKDGRQQR